MILASAWVVAALGAGAARADVALVQVVQSQDGRAADGTLAKNLLEVSGDRARLVAALARKVSPERSARTPRRQVELLDLSTTTAWLLEPDRSASAAPAADAAPLDRAPAGGFELLEGTATATVGTVERRCLGMLCSHVRVVTPFSVLGPAGQRAAGRLEQDVWLAPVTGEAEKGLLDLIAFETSFRRATGAPLTPLDRQTYRVSEAAATLGLRPAALERVASRAREALMGMPGYPVSSSIVWWRQPLPGDDGQASRRAPAPRRRPPPPPSRPMRRLVLIDWHYSWKQIDRALGEGRFGRFPLGPLRTRGETGSPPPYREFRRQMIAVLDALERRAPLPGAKGPGPQPGRFGSGPRYEVYSDLTEFVSVAGLPHEHFELPPGTRIRHP